MCRERTDLAIQLKDTKSVVGRLKFVISIILHILFAFFYLTIFNVRTPYPSLLLSLHPSPTNLQDASRLPHYVPCLNERAH